MGAGVDLHTGQQTWLRSQCLAEQPGMSLPELGPRKGSKGSRRGSLELAAEAAHESARSDELSAKVRQHSLLHSAPAERGGCSSEPFLQLDEERKRIRKVRN